MATSEVSRPDVELLATRPPADVISRSAMAAVRLILGLVWLQRVGQRVPPHFRGLMKSAASAADTPSDPRSWLLSHLLAPNREFIGWVLLVIEVALAVMLLLGVLTRLGGLLGIADSLLAGLFVAGTPGLWPWSYFVLSAAHVAVVAGAAGRTFGLDGLFRLGWTKTGARFLLRWS
jgi:thiosulfate dehydrogenase [quinone] large subunit